MNAMQMITSERTQKLERRGVSAAIAAIDLTMVKLKLQDPNEGLGWTAEQCDSAELEYKRYLELCCRHGRGIVPNKIMDSMWHYHILDTQAYAVDCERALGGFLHHFPYFGMRGEEDRENLERAFRRTCALYEAAFGEPLVRGELTGCWHDCACRCWHACSDIFS